MPQAEKDLSNVRLVVDRRSKRLGLTIQTIGTPVPEQPEHEGLSAKDLLYYLDRVMSGPGEGGTKLAAKVWFKPTLKPKGTGPYFMVEGTLAVISLLRHLAAGRLDDVVLYASSATGRVGRMAKRDFCQNCLKQLTGRQERYCSRSCALSGPSRVHTCLTCRKPFALWSAPAHSSKREREIPVCSVFFLAEGYCSPECATIGRAKQNHRGAP